jgi:hypothetical protein
MCHSPINTYRLMTHFGWPRTNSFSSAQALPLQCPAWMQSKMITHVQHISSRCGSGKSYHTIRHLLDRLCTQYPAVPTVILGSKTTDLNAQNYLEFSDAKKASSHTNRFLVPSIRIDSDTHPGSVTKTVTEKLTEGFGGVIFTSHAVLANLSPDTLKGVELILDEIPNSLVATLSVHYEASDQSNDWESNVLTRPSKYPGYEEVYLHPEADVAAIRRVINNIMSNRDNSRTKPVADLLAFLLANYDKLYVSEIKGRRTFRCFQAVQWLAIKQIAEQVASVTILCAQLKGSLFGFVLQYCLGVQINETHQIGSVTLATKHPHTVLIHPFLKKGRWSNKLKQQITAEALCFDDRQPLPQTRSVVEYAQLISDAIMFEGRVLNGQHKHDKHYIAVLNRKDPVLPQIARDSVNLISTVSHGMNHLSTYDHAVYLASNLPNPQELKHLKLFAQDHGATPKSIEEAIMIERCYEAAYQCVARTSIRSKDPKPGMCHYIVVPDNEYAEYLYQWFEPTLANIVTDVSCITHHIDQQELKTKEVLEITIQILRERHQQRTTYAKLAKQYKISLSTLDRCKRQNRDLLEKMGLLKPKRKKAAPILDL